jgi:hypothetical protein
MSDEKVLSVLTDIRNWIRASSYSSVKTLLESAFPDERSRTAYQMLDGAATMDQVRIACKISPNGLLAAAQRWTAMGLMELKDDKKRVRLFDLNDFGLISEEDQSSQRKNNERKK